jgi:hypothetical protein
MESRRLVVWISTAILGFQGVTLAFDLLNCTALGWLYVRLNGFAPPPSPPLQQQAHQPSLAPGAPTSSSDPASPADPRNTAQPLQPLVLFCASPHDRIDHAVNQGLSILAGLALGGSSTGRGQGEP